MAWQVVPLPLAEGLGSDPPFTHRVRQATSRARAAPLIMVELRQLPWQTFACDLPQDAQQYAFLAWSQIFAVLSPSPHGHHLLVLGEALFMSKVGVLSSGPLWLSNQTILSQASSLTGVEGAVQTIARLQLSRDLACWSTAAGPPQFLSQQPEWLSRQALDSSLVGMALRRCAGLLTLDRLFTAQAATPFPCPLSFF